MNTTRRRTRIWGILLVLLAVTSPLPAQPPATPPLQRIYVPVEQLEAVIERHREGVFLPQADFDRLLQQARDNEKTRPRTAVPTAVTSATYQATISGSQLLLKAELTLMQFADGWQSWTFPVNRLAVEQARLGDHPALVNRSENGALVLLTEGRGEHRLQLELSTELAAVGSDQVAVFSLLTAPTGVLTLTAPPGKRLLAGNLQLERPTPLDQPADYRVAVGGQSNLQLRITDRAAENRGDVLVFATTGYGLNVAPGEVTWRALTSLQVFGRPVDRLVCSVPANLEIADVAATGLEGWQLAETPEGDTQLTLTFGQPFDGSRKITFQGVMSTPPDQEWTVPPLMIRDITSHIGQIVIQHPAAVRVEQTAAEGVRPASTSDKSVSDMPDDMGRPGITEFHRYDLWKSDFLLRFVTRPRQREVHTAVAAVLSVSSQGLTLQAAITVAPRFEPLFDLDVQLPIEWTVTAASVAGQPRRWQSLPQAAGRQLVRIGLESPLAAGASAVVILQLQRETEGWPPESDPVSAPLPELVLPQADLVETTLVIRGEDDLDIAVDQTQGLDNSPLQADWERLRLQSQDTRYSGVLTVRRRPSFMAVETVEFARLDPQTLHLFLQGRVSVRGGGVRLLTVGLPASMGENIRFHVPVGPQIIEQRATGSLEGETLWTLRLDQRFRGELLLSLDVDLPRTAGESVQAPLWRFPDAERQNGFFAIEAGADQRLTIQARSADASPLPDADPLDVPRALYMPRERVIAVQKFVTAGATLALSEEHFAKIELPVAVCSELQLESVLGETGEIQHRAVYQLSLAGVQSLRVQLPEKAMLWAARLNGAAVEVREKDGASLLPVTTGQAGQPQALELVYRSAGPALTAFGSIHQLPPQLTAISGTGTGQPIEVLQQSWRVHHPRDTLLVASHGGLEPTEPLDNTGWLRSWRSVVKVAEGSRLYWTILTLGLVALLCLLPLINWGEKRWGGVGSIAMLIVILVVFARLLIFVPLPQAGAPTASSSWFGTANTKFSQVNASLDSAPESASGSGMTPSMGTPVGPPGQPQPTNGSLDWRFRQQDPFSAEGLVQENRADAMGDLVPTLPSAPVAKPTPSPDQPVARNYRIEETDHDFLTPAAEAPPAAGQPGRAGNPVVQVPPPQAAAPPPAEPQEAKAGARPPQQRGVTSGLLSLSIQLPVPSQAGSKLFRYYGTSPEGADLQFDFINRQAGKVLRMFFLIAGLAAGWFLRRLSAGLMLRIALLFFCSTLALAAIAPLNWQVLIDGVWLAGWGLLAGWLFFKLVSACCRYCVWQHEWSRAVLPSVWTALVLSQVCLPGVVQAQTDEEKTAAAPAPFVVIPYSDDDRPGVAERVFLPQAKFREIWDLAHPEQQGKTVPPHDGGLFEALYAAKLVTADRAEKDAILQLTARYVVRNFTRNALTVPLPFGRLAVQSATLDDKPAALLNRDGQLSAVIPEPGWHVLDLTLAVPAQLSGSTGSAVLPLAPVSAGRFALELPAKDLILRVNGSSTAYRLRTDGERQFAEFGIDQTRELSLSWQPEQTRAGAASVVQVESATAVSLTDAGTLVSSGFQYRIRQGSVSDVQFALPGTMRLRSVLGPDVGGWELTETDGQRRLRVFFRRTVNDATQLTLELFQPLVIGSESQTFEVSPASPLETAGEVGLLGVFASSQFTVRGTPGPQLTQINLDRFTTNIPISRPESPPALAFRYTRQPATLSLSVSRQATQVVLAAQHGVSIQRRKSLVASRFSATLTGAPRTSATLLLPPGYLLLDVKGPELKDWYLTRKTSGDLLTVEFAQARTGLVELALEGVFRREDNANTATLPLPRLLEINRQEQQLAVWLDNGLSPQVQNLGQWKSIDASLAHELAAGLGRPAPQLAFTSQQTDPAPVELSLTQLPARLAGETLVNVTASDVGVACILGLQWDISQASTDTLTFSTPDMLANRLEFSGPNLREAVAGKPENGRIRWTVSLRTPQTGRYFLSATAMLPPATGEVTAPGVLLEETAAPGQFRPLERQRAFLLLINASPNQLNMVDPNLVEPVQKADLAIILDDALVAQATELARIKQPGTGPVWTIQRFAQAASLPASVNVADYTTVLARDGSCRSILDLTIKNRTRQFLAVRLPSAARLLAVTVAGQPSRAVETKLGPGPVQLIALPRTSAADTSFVVRLVYSARLPQALPRGFQWARQELELPAALVVSQQEDENFGIPVARTRWTVYLPEDLRAIPSDGGSRNNLNPVLDANHDLTYQFSAVQEINDLLSVVESQASSSTRELALGNLRQVEATVRSNAGQANEEYARVQTKALTRLAETRKKLSDESQPVQQSVDGANLTQALPNLQTADDLYDLNSAVNFGILSSNGIFVAQPGQESNGVSNFSFSLPQSGSAPTVAGVVIQNNIDSNSLLSRSRAAYQNQNAVQLEQLRENSSKSSKKEDAFYKQLWDTETASIVPPGDAHPMHFGDDWKDITTRRRGAQRAAGGMAGNGPAPAGKPQQQAEAELALLDGALPAKPGATASHDPATGLSLAMPVPLLGQKLIFSKPGGEPRLALLVQPADTVQVGLAWVWASVWGVALIVGWWGLSRPAVQNRLQFGVPLLLAGVGAIGSIALAAPFNLLALALFVVGAIWLTVVQRASREAAA